MSGDVIGFILAGGRGRRMRAPHKGLLRHASGGTVLAHLVAEMRAGGIEHVILVANESEAYVSLGLAVIPDLRKGRGPLGGIEAGLDHVRAGGVGRAAIFLPCDVPNISRREIALLLEAYRGDPGGAAVARVEGEDRFEALCCVVGVDVLPAVQAALDEGRLSVSALWRRLGAHVVRFPDGAPFLNINTPEEHARSLAGEQP